MLRLYEENLAWPRAHELRRGFAQDFQLAAKKERSREQQRARATYTVQHCLESIVGGNKSMGASQARVIFCLLSCEETQVECWTMPRRPEVAQMTVMQLVSFRRDY